VTRRRNISKKTEAEVFKEVLIDVIAERIVDAEMGWIKKLPIAYGRKLTPREMRMYRKEGARNGW
jgi:hypothetical protein